jgi:predicted naringenin-chalcone synthase
MNAQLRAIATATPDRFVTQEKVYDFFDSHFKLAPDERDLYRRILLDGPIHGRYFGLDYDEQICESTKQDQLIQRFVKYGLEISCRAARKAIKQAELKIPDIGGLVVNTCTGYLCPGLSSYIAKELELNNHIKVFDLMGMGCGAAIPNLECASRMLPLEGDKSVLSISVEICSATIFMEPHHDIIVSNSIFGDGAAASVIQNRSPANSKKLLKFIDFESVVLPQYREHLRYRNVDGRLRNVLSKRVPIIGARAVSQAASRLLSRNNLSKEQIDWWVVHPGGTQVLKKIEEEMDLPRQALDFSYGVLRDFGNMSSPTVLFVLERILQQGQPKQSQKGLLLSFGAGFTAFASLVEF